VENFAKRFEEENPDINLSFRNKRLKFSVNPSVNKISTQEEGENNASREPIKRWIFYMNPLKKFQIQHYYIRCNEC